MMYSDVRHKIKLKRKMLYTKDSVVLQELIELMEKQNHRTLVLWALDCAQSSSNNKQMQKCIDLCTSWSKGEIKVPVAKKAILELHQFAKTQSPSKEALCRAIAHAGASVHVQTHAVGLIIYELTSLTLENIEDYEEIINDKISFYKGKLIYWKDKEPTLQRPWAKFLLR